MTNRAAGRRIVGIVMLVSSAALLTLAALVYGEVIRIAPEGQRMLAGVLFVASMADMVIGLRFLSSSEPE